MPFPSRQSRFRMSAPYFRIRRSISSRAIITVTAVEERLILLYSEGVRKGKITLPQLVKYACTNPARVAGLYPRKGTIEVGADADLVILDPGKEWTLTKQRMHSAVDYTCYEGMKIKGAVERVLLRGKTIVQNGKFLGERGDGQYLHRGTSSLA